MLESENYIAMGMTKEQFLEKKLEFLNTMITNLCVRLGVTPEEYADLPTANRETCLLTYKSTVHIIKKK